MRSVCFGLQEYTIPANTIRVHLLHNPHLCLYVIGIFQKKKKMTLDQKQNSKKGVLLNTLIVFGGHYRLMDLREDLKQHVLLKG